MRREAKWFMWGWVLVGGLFAVAIGVAANDRGMIVGALAAMVGGLVVAPLAARLWER